MHSWRHCQRRKTRPPKPSVQCIHAGKFVIARTKPASWFVHLRTAFGRYVPSGPIRDVGGHPILQLSFKQDRTRQVDHLKSCPLPVVSTFMVKLTLEGWEDVDAALRRPGADASGFTPV